MNKINELYKVLKDVNDAFNKRFGDINMANDEILMEAAMIMVKVSLTLPNNINNIRQKATEVFFAIQNSDNNALDKYADKELDYLITLYKLVIEECKK